MRNRMSAHLNSRHTPFLLTFFILLPILCPAQKSASDSLYLKTAREIIQRGYCSLITIDSNGAPRVRAMDPFPPEANFEIWFGTNPNSRKVGEIKSNPTVTLYYLDNDGGSYVTIRGKAEIVEDAASKRKKWKTEWESFYPNYPEDYMLIKVIPLWMEIVSPKHNIEGDEKTWTPTVYHFGN